MLLDKYEPKTSREIVGNESKMNEIRDWMKIGKGSLLVYGPPGCGKTVAIRLLAKELGYEIIETNASDNRGLNAMRKLIESSKQSNLFLRKRLVMIDEAELLDSTKGINELMKSVPTILIASDYDRRFTCRKIRFDKIPANKIAHFLRIVCMKENVEMSDSSLYQLARMSNGDLRAALIDMEFGFGYREREENIFEKLRMIFKTDMKNARESIRGSDPKELFPWIEESIPEEYSNIENVALAYDRLSKADLFRSRIMKRQAWNLEKYMFDFISGMPKSRGFVLYKLSSIRKIDTNPLRERIAKELHISKKESIRYFYLIRMLAKKCDLGLDDVTELLNS
ncbi:MAG: AAA family ATPase [Candidatus Aenigmatarchaeota archaeon]